MPHNAAEITNYETDNKTLCKIFQTIFADEKLLVTEEL